MSESNGLLKAALGETERDGQAKRSKFTPPILYKFGEVVKLCRAAPTQGQNDYYTS